MNPIKRKGAFVLALAGASLGMTSCGGGRSAPVDVNLRPVYLGTVTSTSYDGDSDDLLSAGLGAAGLAAATAPGYVDPNNPTAAELRRNAIYNNYRAVLDINANSGYGTLYGPNVDAAGNVTNGAGKVAGTEYLAYSDDGSGTRNVTLMVQVPDSFDPAEACIVTGTSSGSRGIYGAIGSSGEWGLKHHCAVAYTDKGSGTGLYTFDDDGVNLQNGVRDSRAVAGKNAIFAPALSDAARAQFALSSANRVAFKHAHSQQNPEQDWGKFTLQAVEFAFYVLNEKYGTLAGDGKTRTVLLTPKNTITIASSISNGGGSALLAAEQDTGGLISGVAASEPQVQPTAGNYTVRHGGATVGTAGRALFDYSTFAALYQPCLTGSAGRCTALANKGLLTGHFRRPAKRRLRPLARLRLAAGLGRAAGGPRGHQHPRRRHLRLCLRQVLRHRQTMRLQLRPDRRQRFAGRFQRDPKSHQLRGSERHRRQRDLRERDRRRRRLSLRRVAEQRAGRPVARRIPVPAGAGDRRRSRHRRCAERDIGGAERARPGGRGGREGQRQFARQAGDHRAGAQRHAALHRGEQRQSLRFLQQRIASVHRAAARLPDPCARRDVRLSENRASPAAVAGRAHGDAGRQRHADYAAERAAYRRRAAGRQHHQCLRRGGGCAELKTLAC